MYIFYIRFYTCYQSKKHENICNFWYKCSQNFCLIKKSRKIKNLSKQHDNLPIIRFDCNRTLKITININLNTINIELYYDLIYNKSEKINVTQEIKDFIRDRLQHTSAEIFNQLEIEFLVDWIN